jgi:hypothetical protein
VPRAEKRKRLSGIYLRRSVLLHNLDTYRTMSFEAYSGFQKEMTPREPDSDEEITIVYYLIITTVHFAFSSVRSKFICKIKRQRQWTYQPQSPIVRKPYGHAVACPEPLKGRITSSDAPEPASNAIKT